jgi:hypothetical protein
VFERTYYFATRLNTPPTAKGGFAVCYPLTVQLYLELPIGFVCVFSA